MPQELVGRRRAASWIYAVLNPLIEAMRRETGLLQAGNISWRSYSQKAEYLRPIEAYIEDDYRPIFEDFKIENAVYVDRFAEHDRVLKQLEECALEFQRSIMQSDEFQNLVKQSLGAYRGSADSTKPDLQAMDKDLPKYVAEELINNTQQMPSHYTLHHFWQEFRDDFLGYRERPTFLALERARKSLTETSSRLGSDLTDLRLALCREYDVPAAPLEPPRNGSEEPKLLWS